MKFLKYIWNTRGIQEIWSEERGKLAEAWEGVIDEKGHPERWWPCMWSTCLLGMCFEILFSGSLTNKSPRLSISVTWGVQGRLIWTGHLWEDMTAVTVSSIPAPNIWRGSSAHSPIASQGLALCAHATAPEVGCGSQVSLSRAWGKGQGDDHAPPGPVSFLGRDSRTQAPMLECCVHVLALTAPQAMCVIGWALHPLRRELRGPLCSLDMMIWLNLFWPQTCPTSSVALRSFLSSLGFYFPM